MKHNTYRMLVLLVLLWILWNPSYNNEYTIYLNLLLDLQWWTEKTYGRIQGWWR